MSLPKPYFELAYVYDDDYREVEIVPVVALPSDTRMNRREFLGAGATAATVLGVTGCAQLKETVDSVMGTLTKPVRPETPKEQPKATTPPETPREVAKAEAPSKPEPQPAPRPYTQDGSRLPIERPSKTDCGGTRSHIENVTALAMSRAGDLMVSGGADDNVKIWAIPGGKLLTSVRAQSGAITALTLSADGKTLAAATRNNRVTLWRAPEGKLLRTLAAHKGGVTALDMDADGRILVSASRDKTVRLWDVLSGKQVRVVQGITHPVSALALTPDGKLLATDALDGSVSLWRLPHGDRLRGLSYHMQRVTALAVSQDGQILASGSVDSTIALWRIADGELRSILKGHRADITVLRFSESHLASADRNGVIRLWSLPEGVPERAIQASGRAISALAIAQDGKFLASASSDASIKSWDLTQGSFSGCLVDLKASPANARGVTYNVRNEYGQLISYTLPCGSPIPSGAVCTCNCVPGSWSAPPVRGGGGQICTCVPVCVCMAVPVCQAHRLLHSDRVVRRLAEELLLGMGWREFPYMRWAADNAEPGLRERILRIVHRIAHGASSNPAIWPTVGECRAHLWSGDEVIAIMAAQMLAQWSALRQVGLSTDEHDQVVMLLNRAKALAWYRNLG